MDRLRHVVAFAVSGLCRQVSFHKPFNPILGETYQVESRAGMGVGSGRRMGGAAEGGSTSSLLSSKVCWPGQLHACVQER